jgi:hypothetical protein
MSKSRKRKRPPKHVLALPELEQSKTAVLNSLASKSGQRTYHRAIPCKAFVLAAWKARTGSNSNKPSGAIRHRIRWLPELSFRSVACHPANRRIRLKSGGHQREVGRDLAETGTPLAHNRKRT